MRMAVINLTKPGNKMAISGSSEIANYELYLMFAYQKDVKKLVF